MIKYRQGGLMRCCIATIEDDTSKRKGLPKEGEELHCLYCSKGGAATMVWRNGAWEWRGIDDY